MAKPLKPLVRGGGYYPSNRWTPLVYPGGFTTANGGEQPEPSEWKTVSGVSPLSLVNALAYNIKSLTQYGKCTQSGTPTPDAPKDIVCNNGKIAASGVVGTPEVLSITAEDEYEGDIVTFDSPNLSNIAKLSVKLEPVQAGSGDPSPDNIRPISGHTSVNVIVSPTLNPLDGTTYTIPLGQTIYGGTLDVTTGVLTKTHGIVDMGSLDWTKVTDSGKTRFYAAIPDMVSVPAARTLNLLSSCYKTNIGGAWDDDKTIYNGGSVNRVYVYDSNYTEATEVSVFQTAVTGQSIVYPLAQPLTYQISPVTVNLLRGENNIWSDVGAVYIVVERAAKQTASVANLFAVGDYKDEQDIISGLLTHKVGIKVFDGTENWELHAAASGTYRLDGVFTDLAQGVPILSSLLCTNFIATNTLATADFTPGMARWGATSNESVAVYTSGTRLYACFGMSTVEAVKQYLAAQYAAGTPVIIVYPLEDETTEQTTPHSLRTTDGTNIVSVTSNVDPVTLSAEYASSEE